MHRDTILQLDESVRDVFALMLNRECRPDERHIRGRVEPSEAPTAAGISASVVFSGSIRGVCSVLVGVRGAAAIVEELVGTTAADPPTHDAAVLLLADGAGELCNMIAGSWKGRQRANDAECTLSTPVIRVVKACELDSLLTRPGALLSDWIIRMYRFRDDWLRLELSVEDASSA